MSSLSFTTASNEALVEARDHCEAQRHTQITPSHLALVLAKGAGDRMLERLLVRCGGDLVKLRKSLEGKLASLPKQDPPPDNVVPDSALTRLLKAADGVRKRNGDSHISIDSLVQGCLSDASLAKLFTDAGVAGDRLVAAISDLRGSKKVEGESAEGSFEALKKYASNLTDKARSGALDPVIGRDEETRRVLQIMCRRTKNNAVLVGPPGCGKTSIVEKLAQRVCENDVPSSLENLQIWSLDLAGLLAGAKFRGEFEERLKSVLTELVEARAKGQNVCLFVDEVHMLMGAGKSEGAMDAANTLKPLLARGELRLLGATTEEEYRLHIEKDEAFARRMQPVHVAEPSLADTVAILRGIKSRYEAFHGTRILDSAITLAARLAKRYISGRKLPDSAVDLIDEAAANVRVQLDSSPEPIDKLERRIMQLEVEATALEGEGDAASKARLAAVQRELEETQEKLRPLQLKYEVERRRVEDIKQAQRRLEALKSKLSVAERMRDLALVADLRFGAIPDLEKKLLRLQSEAEEVAAAARSRAAARAATKASKAAATSSKCSPSGPCSSDLDLDSEASEGESSEDEDGRLLIEVVGPDQVADVVSKWTGIPVSKLAASEKERLLHLSQHLHERVKGQDAAVDAVAQAILRARAGMSAPGRPISILAAGPTGTGKTELAKALAQELFDDVKNIVRIDGAEYSESHSISRLIGAPPGYVGHEQGGQLTEPVRRRPFSVILFDEVEKMHPSVTRILLGLLDDGRVTDSHGRTVDFSNCIVMMTTNLGAQYLMREAEEQQRQLFKRARTLSGRAVGMAGVASAASSSDSDHPEELPYGAASSSGGISPETEAKVMAAIKAFFAPELLNRFAEITIFGPLHAEQLREIAHGMVQELGERLEDRDISIVPSARALNYILSKAYNPAFGARPLRRFIEKELGTDIARLLIAGSIPDHSSVEVTVPASVATAAAAAAAGMPVSTEIAAAAATGDGARGGMEQEMEDEEEAAIFAGAKTTAVGPGSSTAFQYRVAAKVVASPTAVNGSKGGICNSGFPVAAAAAGGAGRK